jgi:hypothetical protein
MRYLSILILSSALAPKGFAQPSQSAKLVFVSSGDESPKNYEAVIDDVSYFSANNFIGKSQEETGGSQQNTIWLDNFKPGKHSITVYDIRKGANEERASNSPVYSSTFTVKEGLDTKIAVKSNGHVQVSEKIINSVSKPVSSYKENGGVGSTGKNVYRSDPKASGIKSSGDNGDSFDNDYKKKQFSPASANENDDDTSASADRNFDAQERHGRKRLDTAVMYSEVNNDNTINTRKRSEARMARDTNDRKSNYKFGTNKNEESKKAPMKDDQFNELYETVRNQWLPGQKMKTLSNEFLNAEDNFSTAQAKQLIKLLTEEGNRLKLAKAVYQCISDPENFSDLDTLLRYRTSRAELDNFVNEGGKE